MHTVTDLFTPLTRCTDTPDPVRRNSLISGVLAAMNGSNRPVPDDTEWPALQELIPSRERPPRSSPAPWSPGLPLVVTADLDLALLGDTVTVPWTLGGIDTRVVGHLFTYDPVSLRATVYITRSGYTDNHLAVPDILRAYDGLLTLKFSHREAVRLVKNHPGPRLLDAVITTYRARQRLRSPPPTSSISSPFTQSVMIKRPRRAGHTGAPESRRRGDRSRQA